MIYIDPPYNTGKEFIYPDNYSESLETYLAYAGLADSEGKKFSTNTANEGRFHTKWLNMMYPRLYLARNLLKDDGVIFISIDDNEVENLRRMCDEIFGEENFIACVIWQKVYAPKSSARHFSGDHDYVIIYARNAEVWMPGLLPRTDEQNSLYKNPDNDVRGPWRPNNLAARNYYSKGTYSIKCPSGRIVAGPPKGLYWKYSEEKFWKLDQDGRIWWGEDGNNIPAPKIFLSEVMQGRVPQTLWKFEDVGHTQEAKRELLERVQFESSDSVFETPKPTRLIKRMLQIGCPGKDGIVLDFFAGSASTADAVNVLNFEEGTNRKYIVVQLPEKTEYQDFRTVADIGKRRILSSSNSIKEKIQSQLDLSNNLRLDLGFRVLKLFNSNFKPWQLLNKDTSEAKVIEQLELTVDHIDPNATQEDLLYELLLKSGIKPTEKIEHITLVGHQIFSVAEGSLLVHLEDTLTKELIDTVLQAKPLQFICLDRAFHGNDQLKCNAVKTFENHNQNRTEDTHIVFRTI